MRALLKKIILWALEDWRPAPPPPPDYDPAALDKISSRASQV